MPLKDLAAQKAYDKWKYYRNREHILRRVTARYKRQKKEIAKYYRKWKSRNRDSNNAYRKLWRNNLPEAVKAKHAEKARQWHKAHPEKALARVKRYERKNKAQYIAHTMMRAAINCGYIVKPNKCSDCGMVTDRRRIHGHHPDYSKPLEVIWLCHPCHLKAHNGSFHNAPVTLRSARLRAGT